MGNFPILSGVHKQPAAPSPEKTPMRWRVYSLRNYRGERKQQREEILRMVMIGALTLDREENGKLKASLT